ncbi:LapA family protein [Luteimonas aestuarii]|uniref:LapA family protein n=1 Tax=Luteimonas aestuarii TaxID=453837 RepID=A0A4R5TYM1_9GAMM|nr:LapA family protein [Luteimonas aestuarii]TDK26315.1 LapA family protein [Luteimonas aestuarii]
MIEIVVSVVTGALISWLASWRYYKRAGDALKSEADKLRTLTERIVLSMEDDAGLVKPHGHGVGRCLSGENVADASAAQTGRTCKTDFMMEPVSDK